MACVEVSDIHLGWEDACALEETGEFQAGAAKRNTSECGDRPRAEGRGERRDRKQMKYGSKYPNLFKLGSISVNVEIITVFVYFCCVMLSRSFSPVRNTPEQVHY